MKLANDRKLLITPKARCSNLVVQKVEDEKLVYDLNTNRAFCLNRTVAVVWNECNGINTVAEIVQRLNRHFQQPCPADLVFLTILQLKKHGLIENDSAETIDFGSRREMIKKVGLATAIALPLISSVIAPSAVNAQSSCLPEQEPCTLNSQCCTRICLFNTCDICQVRGEVCLSTDQCCAGLFCDPETSKCCAPGLPDLPDIPFCA